MLSAMRGDAKGPVAGRGRTVTAVLALADQGVRASAVRLPRSVHNNDAGGSAGLLPHYRACQRRRGT